jgi:hypothetical protein
VTYVIARERARQYRHRATAKTRVLLLSFVLGTMATVGAIAFITPGLTFDFLRSGPAVLVDLLDTRETAFVVSSPVNDVGSTQIMDYNALGNGGPLESSAREEKPCEDAMWSSLKEKCLSFAGHRRYHRRVIRSIVYFEGR